MKVLVIGGNGSTGRRVARRLREEARHDPLVMIRDPSQRAFFDELGVPTVLGDLEYPIDHAVHGCDAVIFAAGSGAKTGKDKTVLVDHLGAIRSMVAAREQGAKRYVMLSSLNADVESRSKIAHYHRAKALADDFLRRMEEVLDGGLDWTTVHPGRLIDDPGKLRVAVRRELSGSGTTSRDDVAAALVACLDLPNTIGKSFALLAGDTPLADALSAV